MHRMRMPVEEGARVLGRHWSDSVRSTRDDANTRFRGLIVEHLDLAENHFGKMFAPPAADV